MTTNLTRPANQHVTIEEVIRITSKWPDLLRSPIGVEDEARQIRQDVALLSHPSDHVWLMARIGSLLHPYYAGRTSGAAMKMIAEDWAKELGDYPEWAITKAVRWWKSADNPDRKRKPIEGDISERCKIEMGVVKAAEYALRKWDQGGRPINSEAVPPRPTLTDAQMAAQRKRADKIMQDAGFKTFGAGE